MTTAALAAVAMGVQNAVARRIAVPDLNTAVVSMSMTGLAADYAHSTRGTVLRRASAVVSLLVGAVLGAVIVGTAGAAAAFGLILLVLAGVGRRRTRCSAAGRTGRADQAKAKSGGRATTTAAAQRAKTGR